jgi:anti-sigma factor RsiW
MASVNPLEWIVTDALCTHNPPLISPIAVPEDPRNRTQSLAEDGPFQTAKCVHREAKLAVFRRISTDCLRGVGT